VALSARRTLSAPDASSSDKPVTNDALPLDVFGGIALVWKRCERPHGSAFGATATKHEKCFGLKHCTCHTHLPYLRYCGW
jgi:hypothetical protein